VSIVVRRCKRRRVRDVEELSPELQSFRFGELELLDTVKSSCDPPWRAECFGLRFHSYIAPEVKMACPRHAWHPGFAAT
jgi:hypothetical protein